jgi:hypothetical protein
MVRRTSEQYRRVRQLTRRQLKQDGVAVGTRVALTSKHVGKKQARDRK